MNCRKCGQPLSVNGIVGESVTDDGHVPAAIVMGCTQCRFIIANRLLFLPPAQKKGKGFGIHKEDLLKRVGDEMIKDDDLKEEIIEKKKEDEYFCPGCGAYSKGVRCTCTNGELEEKEIELEKEPEEPEDEEPEKEEEPEEESESDRLRRKFEEFDWKGEYDVKFFMSLFDANYQPIYNTLLKLMKEGVIKRKHIKNLGVRYWKEKEEKVYYFLDEKVIVRDLEKDRWFTIEELDHDLEGVAFKDKNILLRGDKIKYSHPATSMRKRIQDYCVNHWASCNEIYTWLDSTIRSGGR
ncbi:MAG: hypothetical protein ACTSRU_09065, partial [Candidatus Hodarchaeales archaeon]